MFCPRCNSPEIKYVEFMGVQCMICLRCGYDERELYNVYPEQKTNQKVKGQFSPYREGGRKGFRAKQ